MLPVEKIAKRLIYDIIFSIGVILLVFGIFLNDVLQEGEKNVEEKGGLSSEEEQVSSYPLFDSVFDYQLNVQEEEEIKVNIPPGSTGIMIARLFEEKGLMEAEDFHKLMVLFDIERRLKAGEYTFSSKDSPIDILDKILLK